MSLITPAMETTRKGLKPARCQAGLDVLELVA